MLIIIASNFFYKVPLTEALKADIGKKQLADASSHEQVNYCCNFCFNLKC